MGGITIAPGEARAVAIRLTSRADDEADPAGADPGSASRAASSPGGARAAARAIPAWVAVGKKAGPRISVVAAARGSGTTAAAAAARLCESLEPEALAGSVAIVPVLRPGGRFAPRSGAGGAAAAGALWRFPGDAAGGRAARDAFTVFSEVAVGAAALVVLSEPRSGRRGALTARGRLDDPRVRRLCLQSGALAAVASRPAAGSLAAAATDAGIVTLELSAAGGPGDDDAAAEALAAAARAVLVALGVLPPAADAPASARAGEGPAPVRAVVAAPAPLVVGRLLKVRAPAGGLLAAALIPGTFVRAGGLLARVTPPLPGRAVPVKAPADGLVLESPGGPGTRKGTPLYVLAPASRAATRRRAAAAAAAGGGGGQAAPAPEAPKLRVGWVEHVTLPDLDVRRLKAKIDTGARTSALHVARMRTVDTTGGPQRRPILEITVPGGARGRKPRRLRAAVREYVVVRDTSGRMERRPVIETALQLGPIKRRIAVTLTYRGDMLFPMLIGRTALGSGIVVDPARRYLLGRQKT